MGRLNVEREAEVTIVTITDTSGFDNPNSDAFRTSILSVVSPDQAERLALDLGKLDTVSSSGIVALLSLKRVIEANQGRLVLFGLEPSVRQVFKVLGLADFFTIVVDRAAAIERLRPSVA